MATRASILEHVINPKKGDQPADFARFILSLDFPQSDSLDFSQSDQTRFQDSPPGPSRGP